MPAKLLIPREQYLASGIHMGMKLRTEDMREFIYKIRPDGLAVLNLRKIDERIRIASNFLARSKNIIVASKKSPVQKGVKKFAELIKAQAFVGRFLPGTLTNPSFERYIEADVVFILDPMIDKQVVEEAVKARVPVIAVCNSFNETRDVDLVIPANNKGKRSLATLLWLLAREILKKREEIKSDKDFKIKVEDFEEE
ncbi:MAG: 30S ribosomal protein S2 [Candidatus Aenigmatarchaeota archaeon]